MRIMTTPTEIKELANAIIVTHSGKVLFNIREIHEITGYSESRIPRMLYDAGIPVKTDGRSKKVSAFGIAELMCHKRTAAI